MYNAGAVIGQLPFAFLFPLFKMNYIIPSLELGWGIFTLLQFRVTGYSELMAYRFLVGLFEVRMPKNAQSLFRLTRKKECFLPQRTLRSWRMVPWR